MPRLLRLAPLLLAAALVGCSASAPATRTAADFSPASLDRVAVVFAQGNIATKGVTTMKPDAAATAEAEAIVPELMRGYADHFGVTLVDAREAGDGDLDPALRDEALEAFAEAVKAVREENRAIGDLPYAEGKRVGRQPLSSAVADEVSPLADHAGSRYLLSIAVQGWGSTDMEKLLDGLAVGFGGIVGAIVAGGPTELAAIETVIVDTERGEVVWYSTRGAVLDPRNPDQLRALTQTAAVELFSGNYIPPLSFFAKVDHDAVVYLVDGGKVTGHVKGPEDLYFTVDTRDGERRVPVEDVKSVRAFSGTGQLFPRTK